MWGWLLAGVAVVAALAQCARPGEPPTDLHTRDEAAPLFPRWRTVRGDASAAGAGAARLPDLHALWMRRDGLRGWIAGDANTLLSWNGHGWTARRVPGADGVDWEGMAFDAEGENGWLVGSRGAAARYADGRWERWPSGTTAGLAAVWVSPSGGEALAVGNAGTLLRLRDRRWQPARAAGRQFDWRGVCVDAERGRVWLKPAGTGLFTLPLDNLGAAPTRPPGGLGEYELYTLACGPRGDLWAAGVHVAAPPRPGEFQLVEVRNDSVYARVTLPTVPTAMWSAADGLRGVVLTHAESDTHVLPAYSYVVRGGRAYATRFPGSTTLTAVWMNATGAGGWATGLAGLVAQATPERLPPPVLERGTASFTKVSGEFSLRLPRDPHAALAGIALVPEGGEPVALRPGTHYTVTTGGNRLRVRFTDEAKALAGSLEHQAVALRLDVVYQVSTPPFPVSFETEPFYLAGPSTLMRVALGLLGVLLLNVALVVAATRWSFARHLAYGKAWSNVVGLVVGKYAVIDPLSIYVPWIRDALFREYRRALPTAHPSFTRWNATRYIDPDIESLDPRSFATPAHGWRDTYEAMHASAFPGMFLVLGPSGVGKSALADQLVRHGTQRGHTVFLIRLATSAGIETEVRTLMRQYGGFPPNPPVLWERGRFVFILDGLNEDRHAEETEAFVRAMSSHHLVIGTAQEPAAWTGNLSVHRIQLHPFGEVQLGQVLPGRAVKAIEDQPDLLEWARLPQSAFLLNAYYAAHHELPDLQAELYLSLRGRLADEALAHRLEAQAWKMFVGHERQFSPDDTLPRGDLERGVAAGILTHRMEGDEDRYRFAHDRIHRFFVAAYRLRQDPQPPFEELRKEVGTADPARWVDVMEFWGELVALQEKDGRRLPGSHATFVHQAHGFGDRVDAVLGRQARTLAERGIVSAVEPPPASEAEPAKEQGPV